VITVFALMIGAMFPIIHLGRPWLFFWLIPYPSSRLIWPNFRSPLVWDFFAITTYLTAAAVPAAADDSRFRADPRPDDRLAPRIYGALALGWQGTTKQWHRLESAMQIMAVAIIPVAVSVHTIVSFDFSMANVPMWHSTIFGPYFVAGAIFSGIAGLIIAMAALRKFLHLEDYLHPVHFQNLAKLLLMMSLLWGYFVFAERLTVWYGNEPSEMEVVLGDTARLVRAAVLDDGGVQLRAAGHDPVAQEAADDRRMRDRLVRRAGRHVARAIPDRRAVSEPQVLDLLVGALPPAAGRAHHHDRHICRDDPALHVVCEAGTDHFGVGAQGR
jgi:formate-dependent nitrite reductase membrane component NrfD